MYNKLNNDDCLALIEIFGKDNVIYQNINSCYTKDELGSVIGYPECVVIARNKHQVSKLLIYANKRLLPVVARGSGTGLVGACVPLNGGIVLDMSMMNKIIELDSDNLTLTVEPGVLLMDIYKYVEERGYFYPPDPGEKTATIGGNIATNAGGMRAVKYGTTRDYVESLEVVLPTGEIEIIGRNVVKDSSGYSLKHLMIGSEGTLGVITKAVLKLLPKPNLTLSLLVPFENESDALDSVKEIIKANLDTIAIEFFVRNTILFAEKFLGKKFPDTSSNAYILLTFEGNTKLELKEQYQKAAALCIDKLHALDALIIDTDERKDSVWKARGAFLEAIKASTTALDECDVVVPRSMVASYIKYTYLLEQKYNVRIPSFGHAGDGNLHIYICKDNLSDEEFKKILKLVFKDLYDEANRVGGLVSGEHGIGYAKKEYLLENLGFRQIELMKGIKNVFDPNHILNPGKVF